MNNQSAIEYRYATVSGAVNVRERIVTVIAVPWEQPAQVMYRSQLWNELFTRGAIDPAVLASPHRVRVNRGHDRGRTVGKTVRMWDDHDDGLLAELRIANTVLGDETLELAAEDMLSLSVGFGAKPEDQVFDRGTMTRRINKAYLDHISFVESPAYEGARVISVREPHNGVIVDAAMLEPLPPRPLLDQFIADPMLRWAAERLNKK